MGYAHGTRWDEAKTIVAIKEVMNFLEIDRMPSRKEIENYYNNTSLTNRMSKTGGFQKYASLLSVGIKDSESKLGLRYEHKVAEKLIKLGYDVELTSTKYPYDILVNKRVKIDIKVSGIVGASKSGYYTFNLEKKQQTCDLYIAIALDENKYPAKTFVIPASVMYGKTQLSVGLKESRYNKYIDKWNLIDVIDKGLGKAEIA